MESNPIVPSIALVINLSEPVDRQTQAHSGLFRPVGVPATWVVEGAQQAKLLHEAGPATAELAITAEASSKSSFQVDLANRLAAVQTLSGQEVALVAGDAQQLRAHASSLANLGVEAVVSTSAADTTTAYQRQLPCGLWRLDPAITLPQPRSRWALLPARQPSLQRILKSSSTSETAIIHIAAAQISRCQKLLQEISQAVRSEQLVVKTVSEIVAQLTSQHEVKPQRSILRIAA